MAFENPRWHERRDALLADLGQQLGQSLDQPFDEVLSLLAADVADASR